MLIPWLASPRSSIRVFISSTFFDMQEERETLVKHVFPELQSRFEARGISLSEIDLRWGILEEETDRGRLLETCFNEIDRCRPFFIGILGEVYGSCAHIIPAHLMQRFAWLGPYTGRSYTELEIRYAILNGHIGPMAAQFYFRETKLGEAGRVDPRVTALKQEIEASSNPVRRYSSREEFAAGVLEDWTRLLGERFPDDQPSGPDDRERARHADYLRRRTELFVPDRSAMNRLNRLIERKGPPLLVRAGEGGGKSALVANWLAGLAVEPERRRPSALSSLLGRSGKPYLPRTVLVYVVEATGSRREWPAILRFLTREAQRLAEEPVRFPDDPESLFSAFMTALRSLAARGPVLLVLDGLDQVVEPSPSAPFAWIPDVFPENVRVLCTLRPGPAYETLRARGWRTLDLPPLSAKARAAIAEAFLANYGKRLPTLLLDRVARAEQAATPLYLRVLLAELRVFGSHELLSSHVELCLRNGTTLELFDSVLTRLENDYDSPPALVRASLALLATARAGLGEEDLLTLLGEPSAPLPRAWWAPLRGALDEFLLDSDGRISLYHETLTDAVRRRYLSDPGRRREVSRRIIAHFRQRGGRQAIEEVPWQIAAVADWEGLFHCIAEPSFVVAAWSADPVQLKRYWGLVSRNLGFQPPMGYGEVTAHPERYPEAAPVVAQLLRETGFLADALRITRELERRYRADGDAEALRSALCASALALRQQYRLPEALKHLKEEETLCRAMGDDSALQANLGNQGVVLRELGRLAEALERHEEEEAVCARLDDGTGIAASWLNQAAVHLRMESLRSCGALLDRSEQSFARLGNALGIQAALEIRGRLLARRGDRRAALACHERQERVSREVLYAPGVRNSLLHQARMAHELLDLDRAVALLDQHARLCKEADDRVSLARGLLLRASVFGNARLLPQAVRFAGEALRMASEAGDAELVSAAERLIAQWRSGVE